MSISDNLTKLIISIIIFIAFFTAIVYLLVTGLELGNFRVLPVSELISQKDEIDKRQSDLDLQLTRYEQSIKESENAKTQFAAQKAKYESISNETIKIIEEATTEESYNIEYMWIKLGNYAKKNNLSIVVVEPGGTANAPVDNNATATTTSTSSSNTTTQDNTVTDNVISSGNALQIQIEGSYMNVSDFIFEVENDTELKFKLDNISMTYVGGTTIKTTFNVKNITINK